MLHTIQRGAALVLRYIPGPDKSPSNVIKPVRHSYVFYRYVAGVPLLVAS